MFVVMETGSLAKPFLWVYSVKVEQANFGFWCEGKPWGHSGKKLESTMEKTWFLLPPTAEEGLAGYCRRVRRGRLSVLAWCGGHSNQALCWAPSDKSNGHLPGTQPHQGCSCQHSWWCWFSLMAGPVAMGPRTHKAARATGHHLGPASPTGSILAPYTFYWLDLNRAGTQVTE